MKHDPGPTSHEISTMAVKLKMAVGYHLFGLDQSWHMVNILQGEI